MKGLPIIFNVKHITMKRSIPMLLSALFICTGFFTTSCSKHGEQAFAKRKYMPWFKTVKKKMDHQPEEYISENTYNVERMDAVLADGEASTKNTILTELLPKQEILWKSITKREAKKQVRMLAKSNYPGGEGTAVPGAPAMNTFVQAQETEFQLNRHMEESSAEVVAEGIVLVLLVILAIILPPLAVLLVDGIGLSFLLSILLTLLFWLPGIIYALIRIFAP